MKTIVSISPTAPPEACGVSDYAWQLSQHWPDRETTFAYLIGREAVENTLPAITPEPVSFGNRGATLLENLRYFPSSDIVLHYAGRGYSRLGCPWWMGRAMRAWKRWVTGSRLIVFFHEVPPDLPLRSKYFLPNWINQRVVRNLCRSADHIVTNTTGHVRQLKKLSGLDEISWFPVPSTINPPSPGEASKLRTSSEIAIFGLPSNRLQVLRNFRENLRLWHTAGRCTRIHLIGPCDERSSKLEDAELEASGLRMVAVRHGRVAPNKVSELLGSSGFGLVVASDETFSKSTTFMAMVTHRCPIVVRTRGVTTPFDQTISPMEVLNLPSDEWKKVSSQRTEFLASWYQVHATWDVVAEKIQRALKSTEKGSNDC